MDFQEPVCIPKETTTYSYRIANLWKVFHTKGDPRKYFCSYVAKTSLTRTRVTINNKVSICYFYVDRIQPVCTFCGVKYFPFRAGMHMVIGPTANTELLKWC